MAKRFVYKLRNNSYSDGYYVVDDETFVVYPRSTVRTLNEPSSHTSNIVVSKYIEDVVEKKAKTVVRNTTVENKKDIAEESKGE